jgi:hypothetical protein
VTVLGKKEVEKPRERCDQHKPIAAAATTDDGTVAQNAP